MVRNYVRKTVPYDRENMRKAVALVAEGTVSVKKAAEMHGLKRPTLIDQVQKRYKKMGAGREKALTPEEESGLATCIKVLSRWRGGMTRKETLQVVGEFVSATGRDSPFVGPVPGDGWLTNFLKRHPTLSVKQAPKGPQSSSSKDGGHCQKQKRPSDGSCPLFISKSKKISDQKESAEQT